MLMRRTAGLARGPRRFSEGITTWPHSLSTRLAASSTATCRRCRSSAGWPPISPRLRDGRIVTAGKRGRRGG
jgi:hypothetical protein